MSFYGLIGMKANPVTKAIISLNKDKKITVTAVLEKFHVMKRGYILKHALAEGSAFCHSAIRIKTAMLS